MGRTNHESGLQDLKTAKMSAKQRKLQQDNNTPDHGDWPQMARNDYIIAREQGKTPKGQMDPCQGLGGGAQWWRGSALAIARQ